jgi:hypothetical protein
MPIYHLHAQMVKRAEGESSVAGAAYRSGSLLYEESTGLTHDYTRKRGVEHSEILAAERRKDAQVAREIELRLPIELCEARAITVGLSITMEHFHEESPSCRLRCNHCVANHRGP